VLLLLVFFGFVFVVVAVVVAVVVVAVVVNIVACAGGVAYVAAVVSSGKLVENIPLSTLLYFLKCC
jgi:hypothetical protein